MSFDPGHDQLDRAYRRARNSPKLIASLIAAWEKAFDGDVAATVGTDHGHIVTLGLCLRPREDSWVADVGELAAENGIDAATLATFLRQAFVAERLAGSPAVSDIIDGRLLAARDRSDEADE